MSSIEDSIKILKATRDNYLKMVDHFDLERLNYIPKGFKNNLVWNFGHVLVTQQLLCYKLSGLPMYVDDDLVKQYRKGTKPEKSIDAIELVKLKNLALSTVDALYEDYEKRIFKTFYPYRTSYNIELQSINEAIQFNNVHEGMHLGTCLAIQKFLKAT